MLLTLRERDDFLEAARVRVVIVSEIVRFAARVAVDGLGACWVLNIRGEGSFSDFGLARYLGEDLAEGGSC